jgi:HSP20 family protein
MARYDPFEEMDRMFEQLRTRMWTPNALGRSDFGVPAFGGGITMDLKKHGKEYVFVADLPGFETEEIDLRFEGDALVLVAESSLRDETTSDETARDEMMGDEMMGSEMTGDESTGEQMAGEETTTETDEIAVCREFTRSRRVSERVTIPEPIAEDEISATYRNGVSASSEGRSPSDHSSGQSPREDDASGGTSNLRSDGVLEVHLPLVGRG